MPRIIPINVRGYITRDLEGGWKGVTYKPYNVAKGLSPSHVREKLTELVNYDHDYIQWMETKEEAAKYWNRRGSIFILLKWAIIWWVDREMTFLMEFEVETEN